MVGRSPENKVHSCPSYLPPSQFRELVQMFSDIKVQDLEINLGLNIARIANAVQVTI